MKLEEARRMRIQARAMRRVAQFERHIARAIRRGSALVEFYDPDDSSKLIRFDLSDWPQIRERIRRDGG